MNNIRITLSLFAIAGLLACGQKSGSDSGGKTDSTGQAARAANMKLPECYAYQTGKDSAFLHIDLREGGRVAGELSYNFYEKDLNRGHFAGTISGDTILARYTFQAEGSESVREVVFLKKGSGWVEGFGEVNDSAGVMLFKDRSKLDFDKGLHFEAGDCPAGR